MNEQGRNTGFREGLEAQLNSPITLLTRLRNLIFGEGSPDNYTKISFFTGLAGWMIFFTWSVLGTAAIRMRYVIMDKKEIDVVALLEKRGTELHFEPGTFISRIESFYSISIFLWALVFIGLVLLWRKNTKFMWFFFSGTIGYILLMWMMLGFSYFRHDTTFFDKVSLFVLIAHTAIYAYILSQEVKGIPIRLFGIDTEEEDQA